MNRFFLLVWGRWIIAFLLIALIAAIGFATAVTFISYAIKGFAALDAKTWEALKTIWFFWLGIGYGVGIVSGLVFGLRFICKRCIAGYRFQPLNCQGERIESIELKRYFKIWRKWFFIIIWADAAQAVVLIAVHKLIFGGDIWIGWFNPLGLTPMILLSGLISFPLLARRCSMIRIEPCVS